MPADTRSIGNDFARDCASLTSFSFIEPGKLSQSHALENRILAYTPLTSLTFPSSLTSFDVFSDRTLEGMQQLLEIHFNGMTYNDIMSNVAGNGMLNTTLLENTNCFGLNHDVKIFGSDNKFVQFTKTSSGSNMLLYHQAVQVDHITIDDFKYGQWYSNAQQLCQYADANYMPVLVVLTQGSSQKESTTFNSNVFNDPVFQEFVVGLDILLCKVDFNDFFSEDASFVLNQWMNDSPTKEMPLLMMYWLKKDGATQINPADGDSDQYADATFKKFAYFNSNASSADIEDARCVHDTAGIIRWIQSIPWFSTYVPEQMFYRPNIESFLNRYPKYKMYANQSNDNYGRYFPVYKLNAASQSRYDINVNDIVGNPTDYRLVLDDDSQQLPPAGTYQYFSLLSTEQTSSIYNTIYDISGIMFKVGSVVEEQLVAEYDYGYQVSSLNDYLENVGIVDSNIQASQSSFFDELYVESDGQPTTDINPDVASEMQFLWNVKMNIELKDSISYDSHTIDRMMLWLSSQAQLSTQESFVTGDQISILVPGNTQYVVSSQMFYSSSTDNQLLWLHEFSNDEGQYSFNINQGIAQSYPVQSNSMWWLHNDDIYYEAQYMDSSKTANIYPQFVREKRAPFGSAITLGEWNGYLDQCSAIAMKYEIPMIAIWSNYGCSNCERLEGSLLNASNLNSFLSSSGLILCFTGNLDIRGKRNSSIDGEFNTAYYYYCWGPKRSTSSFPFIRFLWYKNNRKKKIVDYVVDGNAVDGNKGNVNGSWESAGQHIIDYIKNNTGFASYLNTYSQTHIQSYPISIVDNSGNQWWAHNDEIYYEASHYDEVISKFVREKRAPFGDPVKLGQWNGYLEQCSAIAMQYEIPMIAVWSDHNCYYCELLEKPLISADNVNSFLESSNMILCFTTHYDIKGKNFKDSADKKKYGNDSSLSSYAYKNFCAGSSNITQFPFVRFLWYKNNGTQKIVDYTTTGDKLDGQQGIYQGTYEKAGQNIINYITNNTGFASYLDNDNQDPGQQQQAQYARSAYAGQWLGYDMATNKVMTGAEYDSQVDLAISIATNEHVPLITLKTSAFCSNCGKFKRTTFIDPVFQSWVATSPYIFLYAYSGSGWWTSSTLRKIVNFTTPGFDTAVPTMIGNWIKADGTSIGGKVGSGLINVTTVNTNYIIGYFDDLFSEYRSLVK